MREFPEGLWMDQTFLVPFFFLQVMPRVLLQTGCRAQVWKGAHATKMGIFLVLKHVKIKECHLLSLRTVCIVSVQAVANRYQQEHFGFPVAHLQLLAATITTLGREIWLFHIKAVRARSALSFPHVLSLPDDTLAASGVIPSLQQMSLHTLISLGWILHCLLI